LKKVQPSVIFDYFDKMVPTLKWGCLPLNMRWYQTNLSKNTRQPN